MMDNVVDVSRFPLAQQADEARAKRRIGLGVTGLADALIFCGLRYGSPAAVAITERWMALLSRHAYLASVEMARAKGDRKSVVSGKRVSVRVNLGGCRILTKKKKT